MHKGGTGSARQGARFAYACLYLCPYLCLAASLIVPAAAVETLETIEVIAGDEPGDKAGSGSSDSNQAGVAEGGQLGDLGGTGEVLPAEFAGSHRRIAGETLERRDVTLADLIAFESGVQQRQVGGFGTFASVSMRAASAAQTGVYLDGIRLNGGGNAVVDLATLELLNLSAVDLYRGATPLQLGVGSVGGAVNLNTRRRDGEPDSNRLLLGAGSFGSRRAQLAHQSRQGRWDVLGTVSREHSDNDFHFVDDNGTPLNPDDDRLVHRHNASATRTGVLSRLSLLDNDNRRTDLLLQLNRRDLGVPEWRNAEDNEAAFGTSSLQFQLGQTIDGVRRWNTRHTLFANLREDHYEDRLSQVGLAAQDLSADTESLGAKTYWERLTRHGTLGITGEWRRENFVSTDTLDASRNRSADRDELGALLQYTRYWRDDTLSVSPALGWQHQRDRHRDETGATGRAIDADTVSPQVGVQWIRGSATWSATLGRYYRQPSFGELFGNQGLVQGNSALVAERGTNADITLQWQSSPRWRMETSLFASWRSELISTVYDSQGIGRAVNLGEARILGVEFASDVTLTERLSMRANLTLQDAVSSNGHRVFDGKQLPGEARLAGYARLQYRTERWLGWLETTGNRERYYDQANVLPADDQWLQNAGIEWRRHDLRLQFAISNIADRQVEDYNGFPRPGRQLSVAASLTFK